MQTSSPETAQTSAEAEDDAVARFLTDYADPMRPRQASIDAERPNPLPKASRLLAEALAARRITVKKVVEGRWVFEFAGSTIGGYSLSDDGRGVTTLVSAQARRVLSDAAKLRAHLDLMEIPHPAPLPMADAEEPTEPLFDLEILAPKPSGSSLQVRTYVVGPEAISVLVIVPVADGRALSVDVTDAASPEISTLAVDAMRAVPGLLCASVALQVRSLDSAEGAEVIGIDEAASIVPHHFPRLGRGRAVADAVAEQILFTAAL